MPTIHSQPGIIRFIDINPSSALAVPAHIMAMQSCIDQLTLQRNALEALITYMQLERDRLNNCTTASSVPRSSSVSAVPSITHSQ